jgi:RNA polymerase sigma-70 factor (ECF subfamily)
VEGSSEVEDDGTDPFVRPWYRSALAKDGDAALVRAAQRGSQEGVETLVRRHWDRAHRAAFLIVRDPGTAEDIAQEALLAAIRAIDGFDRRRPFAPWLHRIVVNRALDSLRANRRRSELSVERVPEPTAADRVATATESDLSGPLATALEQLDPESRAVVVLRHVLDYRSAEIAAMLDLPAPTVRTRLRRALERLRVELDTPEGSDL